jgi:hypothetical protein
MSMAAAPAEGEGSLRLLAGPESAAAGGVGRRHGGGRFRSRVLGIESERKTPTQPGEGRECGWLAIG